jgi:hypothetical protein
MLGNVNEMLVLFILFLLGRFNIDNKTTKDFIDEANKNNSYIHYLNLSQYWDQYLILYIHGNDND